MALTDKEREEWKATIAKFSRHWDGFDDAPDDVRDDDELARLAVDKNVWNFAGCSDRLTTDVDFMSHVIEQGPGVFQDLSDRSRDVDGIARLALKQNHRNFELCSDRLRDDDNFARFAVEEYPYDDKIFGHCSERLQADPLMQAYMAIVEAEVNREKPDLTAFPQPIQDAWNIQTPFLSTGNNDKEARELFVGLARGAMEAEARRSQSPSDQVQDAAPLGSGVSAGDLDLDINPYASHTERTLKPANDVDGPEHDLHRGPR